MTSIFGPTPSALPDGNQHIASSVHWEDRFDDWAPFPSVSNLCSSFSNQCSISPQPNAIALSPQPNAIALSPKSNARAPCARSDARAVKDPFGRLPWFALEEVVVNIPDLPTLHQLFQSSPAVADYLNHTTGFFPKAVESIIKHKYRDSGLDEDTRIFLRTLVYLWWKEESEETGIPSGDNPLPDCFHHELVYSLNVSTEGFYEPNKVGWIRLPPSTPPKILRHLLSLASRIRRDAHAFFHGAMKLCLSTKIEELKNPKAPWTQNGPRPRGKPVDVEGVDYPMTWLEEQRIMQAFLKPYIFSVLRRIICEKKLLKIGSPSNVSPLADGRYPDTFEHLDQDLMMDFWRPFANYGPLRTETMEQLETVLSWMVEQKPSRGPRHKGEAQFTTCCPEHTPLSTWQLESGGDSLQHISLPGCFWPQSCEDMPQSGVRSAGFRGEFQKFGVSFWDEKRMLYLGLATNRMDRYSDRKELAFRWSSLLLSHKKNSHKRSVKQKGMRFRSRTKALLPGN